MSLASKARCCLLAPESPCLKSYRGPRLHAATQTCSPTLRPSAPKPMPDQSPDVSRAIAIPTSEGAGLPSGGNARGGGAERRRSCSEPPSQRLGDVVSPAEKAWTLKAYGVCPGIDEAAHQPRPLTGPAKHEFNKVESIKTLHAFGISTGPGIDDDSHQRRRSVEASNAQPTKIDTERVALAFLDIFGVLTRRHFHGAPPSGYFISNHCRMATLDGSDIDVHRGRHHFPEAYGCVQPWAKPSYDDAIGSSPQATRSYFFEMQYVAARYAELVGRPHIRKPSEMPALPAARSEWLRLKRLEEGWQLLGSWHKPVFGKKKALLPVRPLRELEIHNHICSVMVGQKDVDLRTLNEESFIQACLEKPRSWGAASKESCDASTVLPEESVLALEDGSATVSRASLSSSHASTLLATIAEQGDFPTVSDEIHAAKLPLALRRVINAMVGNEKTPLHASASLAARVGLLAGNAECPKPLG